MKIQQLKSRLNNLLEKLKTDLSPAERISTVTEIQEILDALIPG